MGSIVDMSGRPIAPEAAARSPLDDWWYGPLGSATSAGVSVTPESSLRAAAVYACVRVLAESLAQLPLITYQRTGDRKRRADSEALFRLLHDAPNPLLTAYEYVEQQQASLCLRGNAYAIIEPEPAGGVRALWPQDAAHVEVIESDDGRSVSYRVRRPGTLTRAAEVRNYAAGEIHHIRGLTVSGYVGQSPLAAARLAVGMAIAAEDYGARLFANDAKPRGLIEWDSTFKTREELEEFRARWQQSQGGANQHRTAVLQAGMKYKDIGMSNEDAQFLETRRFQTEEIARLFRVPLHLIGDLTHATFSNIEHQGIQFVTHTLGPWMRRWEQAIARDLIPAGAPLFVEFLADALLRGDTESRYNAYSRGIQDGHLTRNEVRRLENRDPLPGLDEPLQPLNMAPVGGPEALAATVHREEVSGLPTAILSARQRAAVVTDLYDGIRQHLVAAGVTPARADAYCIPRAAAASRALEAPGAYRDQLDAAGPAELAALLRA